MKELMSNQKVTVRAFEYDANGKRVTVTCLSRMASTLVGGTNNDKEAIAVPILTRVIARNCPEIDRPNHDVQEKEFARVHKEESGGRTRLTRGTRSWRF